MTKLQLFSPIRYIFPRSYKVIFDRFNESAEQKAYHYIKHILGNCCCLVHKSHNNKIINIWSLRFALGFSEFGSLKPWDATLESPSLNARPPECRPGPLAVGNVGGRNKGSKNCTLRTSQNLLKHGTGAKCRRQGLFSSLQVMGLRFTCILAC